MKILTTNVYVGPNLYAHFPVIRQQIDIGILEQWPSAKIGDDFINADNIQDKSLLTRPLGHIFYHRKKEYIGDELPKFKGYWRSQIKVCHWIMIKLLIS